MKHRICPWWLGYCLMCPWLRRGQDPAKILSPYVHNGMTVLELGSGMGFFTLDLARLVGTSGRVIALDIQPKMLERMKRRADKAGLLDRVNARIVLSDSMDIADLESSVDFTLAFAVVHAFPDPSRFFAEVGAASKSGASLLLSEPEGHVKVSDFDAEIEAASQARFDVIDHPSIRGCRAALLKKR